MPPVVRYLRRMASMGTGIERVRRGRNRLRAAGLRSVQIRVPGIRAAGFAIECSRQSQLIRGSETTGSSTEDEVWFKISDKAGWDGVKHGSAETTKAPLGRLLSKGW